MGTSTSRRSPPTTRFGAFRAALGSDAARAVTELYSATTPGWENQLAGNALAPFAAAAWQAYGGLADALARTETPAAAITAAVTAARNAAIHESSGSLAVALGERAFARLLLSTIGDPSVVSSAAAAQTWTQRRGDAPEALVRRLVGEVARQLALHVASRDVAQLVAKEHRTANDARALVRDVAERAASVAADAAGSAAFTETTLRRDWAQAITNVFTTGRRQRGGDGA